MSPLPFKPSADLRVLAVEINGVLYGPVIENVEKCDEAQNPLGAEGHRKLELHSENPAIPSRISHSNT
jgi:hypothetical protein